jgi:hypothetical protein
MNPEYRKRQIECSAEWHRKHPEANKKAKKKYYEGNVDLLRKFERVKLYSLRHNLPYPFMKTENWKDLKVRVGRRSNGQFISWRAISETVND